MSALEPLRINAEFWKREDVHNALRERDIGTLFKLLRKYAGASQQRIGTAVALQQGTISAIMTGDRAVTSIDVLERIADGLDMPGEARLRLGLAPKEDRMRRRTALGIGLIATISPATLTEVLRESTAEALEFTRDQATSAVGSGTLDHLTAVVTELDRAYQTTPATELFPLARAYRQRVAQLIAGQHTLREARELYVIAARLSILLADLAHDLNSWLAQEAYAIDSQQHALQAGHYELCAWAAESMAGAPFYTGRPGESVKAALKGLRWISDQHPLAVRLRAKAARGHARQGNRAACVELLTEARNLCHRLPEHAGTTTVTATTEYTAFTLTSFAATCHVWLADWGEAERNARHTLGVAHLSPGRADQARLDLAIALTNLGSPDEAVEHANQALSSGRWLGANLPRARELAFLLHSRYPELAGSRDFHDRYQQLQRLATRN